MAHVRKEFSDKVKAEIFVRDRATCAFTGKSVWAFDYGASPLWEPDWPDHIRPSSRGGSNKIENGVCASFSANSKKSGNTRDSAYWFRNGKPTEHYLQAVDSVSVGIIAQLRRFSRLHESDWYLNRAAKDVLLAVEQSAWPEGKKRTPDYWCKSAFKKIKIWETKSKDHPSLEDRKILLMTPDHDQVILLKIRECENLSDVREIKRDLIPYRMANGIAYEELMDALSTDSNTLASDVLKSAEANQYVTPRFLRWLQCTAETLKEVGIERS